MGRKKIDTRIHTLIENCVIQRHRSFFVVVGDKGRDVVVLLHHLAQAASKTRPSVLWCYKKELGFTSHRKKRMRQLQKKIKAGTLDVGKDDLFNLFISSTNVRYCYYSETQKILGNTYGMCVLQDFEALTPNLLARTIETVEGGGIVVLLLRTISSLKQLYTMTMDVHHRYRTESHQDVTGRFNERFLLSLADCKKCVVMNDQMNVLPLTSKSLSITRLPPCSGESALSPQEVELQKLKDSLSDTPAIAAVVNCCRTFDQAKVLVTFADAIVEKTLQKIVTLTAARGRGKSAALGLAIAMSVSFGYSNIFVTSPSPENLRTLFDFVFKGLDALLYQEHQDYEVVQSINPDFNKAVVRLNVFKEGHRQTVQYIHPSDANKLGQAELLVIDEAAAIPLPLVKQLLGQYLVFMSSTINGYEGTGRSLSLKLISQLREKSAPSRTTAAAKSEDGASRSKLQELTLQEPIRYGDGDDVESWLHRLLCLDVADLPLMSTGCPPPDSCDLYYVNRDTLFCYHRASEGFLQRLMSLYVSSHYKNTPNDLQLLSDAPAHHLFVLLPPVEKTSNSLPEILCVVQVCLEGELSKESVLASLGRGKRASGDLIPWTVSQQFHEENFAQLSGGRIVRIATHPHFQSMGYGSRALQLLRSYYSGHMPCLSETIKGTTRETPSQTTAQIVDEEEIGLLKEAIKPRTNLPPLLLQLNERPPEHLHYLGVSYGMTSQLFKFWEHNQFKPVYLRQVPNDLTGEHSCVMLSQLDTETGGSWLEQFNSDFRRRFVSLLAYQFSEYSPMAALRVLQETRENRGVTALTVEEVSSAFTAHDLERLDLYSRNLVDYLLIMDLVPTMARFYFQRRLDFNLTAAQKAVLVGMGLQHKSVERVAKEMDAPEGQLKGLFNRIICKVVKELTEIKTAAVEKQLPLPPRVTALEPTAKTVNEALEAAAAEVKLKQRKEAEILKSIDLSKYAISGTEEEWQDALSKGSATTHVSIKSKKRRKDEEPSESESQKKKKAKRKYEKGKFK